MDVASAEYRPLWYAALAGVVIGLAGALLQTATVLLPMGLLAGGVDAFLYFGREHGFSALDDEHARRFSIWSLLFFYLPLIVFLQVMLILAMLLAQRSVHDFVSLGVGGACFSFMELGVVRVIVSLAYRGGRR